MSAKLPLSSLAQKAHDMRSLLALLQAELSQWQVRLEQTDPESRLVREANVMYANTQKISDLLGSLLHERAYQDPLQLFDLNYLLRDLVNEYQSAFPTVKFIYNGKMRSMFKGVEVDMNVLIRNIIENALKYGQADTIQPQISCKLSLVGKKYQVVIADSGPGIAKQDLNKVFIPFFRGKNVLLPGSGLGLPIARDIVLRHKGKISIESTPGQGTTVLITLPIL